VSSLIIIVCFVVALLAIVGLVFALRESTTSTTNAQKTTPNTPPAPAPASAEAKTTTQLPDLSMIPSLTHSSEQPTSLLTAPAQTASAPLIQDEDAVSSDEHPDIDELAYADLPTIRSLPSNHYDGARAEEGRTRVTYEHLQTIANELRALHSQMKNMQQRINVLTDQVQYLRGNDVSDVNWDVTNPTFKVPAQ
jgi:hypothetical protein